MFHHFTFGTPICSQDEISSEMSFEDKRDTADTGFHLQNTNSSSKTNRKFLKVYTSGSKNNSPTYRKISIDHMALKEDDIKNNKKGCLCFEGCKAEEFIDFGFTSRTRKVSPEKNK